MISDGRHNARVRAVLSSWERRSPAAPLQSRPRLCISLQRVPSLGQSASSPGPVSKMHHGPVTKLKRMSSADKWTKVLSRMEQNRRKPPLKKSRGTQAWNCWRKGLLAVDPGTAPLRARWGIFFKTLTFVYSVWRHHCCFSPFSSIDRASSQAEPPYGGYRVARIIAISRERQCRTTLITSLAQRPFEDDNTRGVICE